MKLQSVPAPSCWRPPGLQHLLRRGQRSEVLQALQPQLQGKLGPGANSLHVRPAGRRPAQQNLQRQSGLAQSSIGEDLRHTGDTAGGQRTRGSQLRFYSLIIIIIQIIIITIIVIRAWADWIVLCFEELLLLYRHFNRTFEAFFIFKNSWILTCESSAKNVDILGGSHIWG